MSEEPQNSQQAETNVTDGGQAAALHSRRAFLFKLSVAMNAAVGAVLAVPLVGYLFGPVTKRESGDWIDLGNLSEFPVGQTRLANFHSPVGRLGDGDTAKVACWVRRVAEKEVQVFAINCAHLGCPVRWFEQSKLFLCPCHGGAYYADGSRASGPPERGLFQYRVRLTGDSLYIHAGDMPTLSTEASCGSKPLVQIEPSEQAEGEMEGASTWQA
ncbi:MAG TPA: ubiquinol-cytochrome c reductase iron-sulfur subunit [Terracidiphilus sp.]|nr:ubiquinol-cytochrome c reductase iron-sulfur subunit [Terracidiphilus sp.]